MAIGNKVTDSQDVFTNLHYKVRKMGQIFFQTYIRQIEKN